MIVCLCEEPDSMSSSISHLTDLQARLVRVLPIAVAMIAKMSRGLWKTGPDYREICDCQRHARRERTLWRRAVRGASSVSHHIRRGTIALVVAIPLAYGATGVPMDAMNILPRLSLRSLKAAPVLQF